MQNENQDYVEKLMNQRLEVTPQLFSNPHNL